MKHTIVKMNHNFEFIEGNSKTSLNGYAFIDENGGTIIIVYGEGKKDDMSKYLNEDGDKIGIKYKCIKLHM
jgi:hypothetical protein